MKLTTARLKKLIKEEIEAVIQEEETILKEAGSFDLGYQVAGDLNNLVKSIADLNKQKIIQHNIKGVKKYARRALAQLMFEGKALENFKRNFGNVFEEMAISSDGDANFNQLNRMYMSAIGDPKLMQGFEIKLNLSNKEPQYTVQDMDYMVSKVVDSYIESQLESAERGGASTYARKAMSGAGFSEEAKIAMAPLKQSIYDFVRRTEKKMEGFGGKFKRFIGMKKE